MTASGTAIRAAQTVAKVHTGVMSPSPHASWTATTFLDMSGTEGFISRRSTGGSQISTRARLCVFPVACVWAGRTARSGYRATAPRSSEGGASRRRHLLACAGTRAAGLGNRFMGYRAFSKADLRRSSRSGMLEERLGKVKPTSCRGCAGRTSAARRRAARAGGPIAVGCLAVAITAALHRLRTLDGRVRSTLLPVGDSGTVPSGRSSIANSHLSVVGAGTIRGDFFVIILILYV